ncbi:glycosyltransferase family 4 protein [Vibrio vulnificus]
MVKVLCVGPKGAPVTGQSFAFETYVRNSSLDIDILYNSGGNKFKSLILFLIGIFYRFFFLKYDAIYFTSSRSRLGFIRDAILVLAFYKESKIVNHLHGADFKLFYDNCGPLLRLAVDFVYNRVSHSIVLTKGMKEQYCQFPSMDIRVVPNFYLENDCCIVDGRDFFNDKIRIIFLSNLIPDKGIIELLYAVKKVNLEYDVDLELLIAGSDLGYEHISLEIEKESSHFDFVKYVGVVSGDEKYRLLKSSHVFALPTYYPTEAQPISILEAMASGCSILTTRHNYIEEFVTNDNGVLVEKKSIQAIIDGLLFLNSNREELAKSSQYNVDYSKEFFSMKKYVSNIDKIIMKS